MEDKDKTQAPITPSGDDKGANNGGKKEGEGNDTPKTLTQDEVNAIVQKEKADAKAKYEKEIEKARAEAKAEAERIAKLTQEEREKELAEQQKQALASKEKELTLRENKLEGLSKLTEAKIPTTFIDFVMSEDKEQMGKNIESFKTEWDKAINAEVENRLKGDTPKAPQGGSNGGATEVVTQF